MTIKISFTYSEDVVQVILMLKYDKRQFTVLNVACSEQTTLPEWLFHIVRLSTDDTKLPIVNYSDNN